MSYRILVKELKQMRPKKQYGLPIIPGEYSAVNPAVGPLTQGRFLLLKSVFPRIFCSPDDYISKQFITPDYYVDRNVFVVLSPESLQIVCHVGYQTLKHFDPKAAVLIYVATAEEHRRKGLMKRLCFLACNQLIMMEYERVYCIPDEGTLISDIYQRLGFVPTSEEFTKKHLKNIQKDLPRDSETSSE